VFTPRLHRYDIFSEFNVTKTAASEGTDVFNVTGANFGPISDNAVTWVHFSPNAYPSVVYEANCSLIVDHTVLRCLTGPNAGEDHRWTISVGNQVSEIPYTATQVPTIASVTVLHTGFGLVPGPGGVLLGAATPRVATGPHYHPSPNVSLGLVTMGGGVVLLSGRCVLGAVIRHRAGCARQSGHSSARVGDR
jgi:hypothetical protein